MNAKELAEKCNGVDINNFPTEEIEQLAKDNGLVIIYGASDDLMELCGSIDDEFGCYDGGTALIDKQGLVPDWDEISEDEEEAKKYFERKKTCKEITSIWCSGDYDWMYKTEMPHETFVLTDDNNETKTYCQGIIFSINDL
jgi:tRNA G10  N-methylase Trm11